MPKARKAPAVVTLTARRPADSRLWSRRDVAAALRSDAGEYLPVTWQGERAQVTAISADRSQVNALVSYLSYLSSLPARVLTDQERSLLAQWGGLA